MEKEQASEALRAEISRQIKAARDDADLTQVALAERLGVVQSVVARIESGEHEARFFTLEKIAEATGATFTITIRAPRK